VYRSADDNKGATPIPFYSHLQDVKGSEPQPHPHPIQFQFDCQNLQRTGTKLKFGRLS